MAQQGKILSRMSSTDPDGHGDCIDPGLLSKSKSIAFPDKVGMRKLERSDGLIHTAADRDKRINIVFLSQLIKVLQGLAFCVSAAFKQIELTL